MIGGEFNQWGRPTVATIRDSSHSQAMNPSFASADRKSQIANRKSQTADRNSHRLGRKSPPAIDRDRSESSEDYSTLGRVDPNEIPACSAHCPNSRKV